jgi:glycopeptide antibiotics resistance protein
MMNWVVIPVFSSYPRLVRILQRFEYSYVALAIFVFLSSFLALVQVYLRQIWVVYVYLFYTVYFFLLFILLFVKNTQTQAVSLNPLSEWFYPTGFRESVLNFLCFVPFGFVYYRAKTWQMLFCAILTVLGIESIQYLFSVGVFSTLDILLNVLGMFVGYRLGLIGEKRCQRRT